MISGHLEGPPLAEQLRRALARGQFGLDAIGLRRAGEADFGPGFGPPVAPRACGLEHKMAGGARGVRRVDLPDLVAGLAAPHAVDRVLAPAAILGEDIAHPPGLEIVLHMAAAVALAVTGYSGSGSASAGSGGGASGAAARSGKISSAPAPARIVAVTARGPGSTSGQHAVDSASRSRWPGASR